MEHIRRGYRIVAERPTDHHPRIGVKRSALVDIRAQYIALDRIRRKKAYMIVLAVAVHIDRRGLASRAVDFHPRLRDRRPLNR